VLQEFRDFINRGNVVELAVAFVLGVAFKPIIDAIVDRLLMPVIGMLVGQPNFDTVGTFACQPADAADAAAGIVVGAQVCAGSVGAIVTALVNFLLVAFALFFVVRAYNRFKERTAEAEPEEEAPAEPDDVTLLREIRDLLARG
jgi:large conductance mechanosensitive channel